jgi:putative heme-binding domain-containing protein
MARQTGDAIVLRDSSGSETRLRKDDIDEMNRQAMSMMPAGMGQVLTREELRDLMSYLQSLQ